MGKSRRSRRRRSDVITFPSSRTTALERFASSNVPVLKYRRAPKGDRIPQRTRLRRYGLTPEQELQRYAPEGTGPEKMVYGWLVKNKFSFNYQESVMGGRVPGGAIIDFVIVDKTPPIALRIQSYWHKAPGQRWADDIQAEALAQIGFQVEDVWEYEVNTVSRVNNKMREIMFGAPKYA